MPRPRKPVDPAAEGGAKRSPLNLRTSPELRAAIEQAALESGLSLTQEVERRLIGSFASDALVGGSETAKALRDLATEIARAERQTGKRWLEDETTFMAASTLLRERLARMRPHPPNLPTLLEISKRRDEADASVLASLKYLEKIGAIRRVNAKMNALLHYSRSFERPGILGGIADIPTLRPKVARYDDETENERALHEGLLEWEYELAVDPRSDPATWELIDRKRPLLADEKERVAAIVLHLPSLFEDSLAAKAEFEAAWQPSIEAAQRGQEIARQLRELEKIQSQPEGDTDGAKV